MGDETVSGEDISIEDRIEFIDNMTSGQFDILKKFFESMPVVENEISFKCPRSFFDLFNPDRDLFGKSICEGSPLITILEFSPILVKNIFI